MANKKGIFVYIDAANLEGSVEACGYKTIDYAKLYNWLRTSRNSSRVYLYAGYSNAVEKKALISLEKIGYAVVMKKVMQYPDQTRKHKLTCPDCKKKSIYNIKRSGRRKANCDSELTLDVISDGVRKKYSEIIVFSGDGDFGNMYEHVVNILKKKVTIYSPMGAVAGLRTSRRVKNLGAKQIITVNALEGILPQYGRK